MPEEEEIKSKHSWKFDHHFSRILGVVFPAVYALILCVFCLVYKVFPGPEFIVLFFLIYAMSNKWSRRFVKDWAPFVAFFLSYEALNSLVGSMPKNVHVEEPISLELRLFGTIPTLLLQQFCRSPVLDYLGAVVYSLHFIAPVIFGFILWKYRRKDYWKYILAFAICTYSALLTFWIYPVAPPWFGVKATRILFQVDHNLGVPIYRTIFDYIAPNSFAAFPSLHATYPWLISLYALKSWKTKASAVVLFPISVWFSAVYLGEHYVVDVIGGVAYATFAFLLVEKLIPQLLSRCAHLERSLRLR
jgi:membrane-associated phospholipid phosphatase